MPVGQDCREDARFVPAVDVVEIKLSVDASVPHHPVREHPVLLAFAARRDVETGEVTFSVVQPAPFVVARPESLVDGSEIFLVGYWRQYFAFSRAKLLGLAHRQLFFVKSELSGWGGDLRGATLVHFALVRRVKYVRPEVFLI